MEERFELIEERLRNNRTYSYESGEYFRSLRSIWQHESCDFDGSAIEWKRCQEKDEEAIQYYTNPKAQGDDQVSYYKDLFVTHTIPCSQWKTNQ